MRRGFEPRRVGGPCRPQGPQLPEQKTARVSVVLYSIALFICSIVKYSTYSTVQYSTHSGDPHAVQYCTLRERNYSTVLHSTTVLCALRLCKYSTVHTWNCIDTRNWIEEYAVMMLHNTVYSVPQYNKYCACASIVLQFLCTTQYCPLLRCTAMVHAMLCGVM